MKIRTLLISLIVIIIVCLVFFVQFKKNDINTTPEGQLINTISQDKLKLSETFTLGHGLKNKLTGLVVESKDNPQSKIIAYTTKDAKYLLYGNLFSKSGENLTQAYTEIYNPVNNNNNNNNNNQDSKSNLKKLNDNFLSELKKSTYSIFQGDKSAPKTLTIFMDPNCPWCHRDFEELQPYIESKKVSVNWVIVGLIKNSSTTKASAILSAKDQISALKFNSKNFDEPNENGGVTEKLYPISESGAKKAKDNFNFFVKQKFQAVPLIIFKNNKGNTMLFEGYAGPNQMENIIEKIKSN